MERRIPRRPGRAGPLRASDRHRRRLTMPEYVRSDGRRGCGTRDHLSSCRCTAYRAHFADGSVLDAHRRAAMKRRSAGSPARRSRGLPPAAPVAHPALPSGRAALHRSQLRLPAGPVRPSCSSHRAGWFGRLDTAIRRFISTSGCAGCPVQAPYAGWTRRGRWRCTGSSPYMDTVRGLVPQGRDARSRALAEVAATPASSSSTAARSAA